MAFGLWLGVIINIQIVILLAVLTLVLSQYLRKK